MQTLKMWSRKLFKTVLESDISFRVRCNGYSWVTNRSNGSLQWLWCRWKSLKGMNGLEAIRLRMRSFSVWAILQREISMRGKYIVWGSESLWVGGCNRHTACRRVWYAMKCHEKAVGTTFSNSQWHRIWCDIRKAYGYFGRGYEWSMQSVKRANDESNFHEMWWKVSGSSRRAVHTKTLGTLERVFACVDCMQRSNSERKSE